MINRNLAIALVTAGVYIGGALAMKAAERAGLLTHDTVVRTFEVFSGLTLAVYANFLPKRLGTFRNPVSAMRMEQVLRVSGWAYMLGGLGFAIAWLLPVPGAVPIALLGTVTAYVLGYSVWAFMEHGPRKGEPHLDA
jgi:hypothetical protein